MRVAVLNGVNLDVLGRRSPEHYGGLTLAELESRIYAWSKELECTTRCRQTNHEGQFVEWCHDALDWADGVILNPGAWSHYSYAIRDAVELFTIPVLEVHLSNIKEREAWRQQSVVSDLATQVISGKGPDGYREALVFLAENFKAKEEARTDEAQAEAARTEAAQAEAAQPEEPQTDEAQSEAAQ